MRKFKEPVIDYVAYAKYLEDIALYANDVIEGKYDSIPQHKMLPIKSAIEIICIRREAALQKPEAI